MRSWAANISRGEEIFVGLLVAGTLIMVLEERLFGPAVGITFPDARPEVVVCSDGVVVRNRMRMPIREVTVLVNDYTNHIVHLGELKAHAEIGIQPDDPVTVTQVVVWSATVPETRWIAERDGKGPGAQKQRRKTMEGVMGKK